MSNINQNLKVNDSDDEEENTDSDEEENTNSDEEKSVKMTSYKVVRVNSIQFRSSFNKEEECFIILEKKVNTSIEQGWSCIGGVSIVNVPEYQYVSMSQTMIKNNKVLDEQTKQNQELLSKLDEQVKLNGELCKRLFDLK
jgi:hypothetical protein